MGPPKISWFYRGLSVKKWKSPAPIKSTSLTKSKNNILTASDIVPFMHLLEENGECGILKDVGTGVAERVHDNKERREPWSTKREFPGAPQKWLGFLWMNFYQMFIRQCIHTYVNIMKYGYNRFLSLTFPDLRKKSKTALNKQVIATSRSWGSLPASKQSEPPPLNHSHQQRQPPRASVQGFHKWRIPKNG